MHTTSGREGRMAIHIRRREFIFTLGGAAAAWPLAARAQQAGKVPTIGYLGASTPAEAGPWIAAFVQRLRELGWIEGRTVAIEYRWGEARSARLGRDHGRVRSAQGRCHRHLQYADHCYGQESDVGGSNR